MKEAIQAHVDATRHTMFKDATEHVKNELDSLCEDLQRAMATFVRQSLAEKMGRDYMAVLVGEDGNAQDGTPVAERMLRDEMSKPLADADRWFAALLPPEEGEAVDSQLGDDDDLIAQQLEGARLPSPHPSDRIKAEPL